MLNRSDLSEFRTKQAEKLHEIVEKRSNSVIRNCSGKFPLLETVDERKSTRINSKGPLNNPEIVDDSDRNSSFGEKINRSFLSKYSEQEFENRKKINELIRQATEKGTMVAQDIWNRSKWQSHLDDIKKSKEFLLQKARYFQIGNEITRIKPKSINEPNCLKGICD